MMEHEGGTGYRPQLRVGMYREMPGSDILKQGYLKKLKTMKKKYFVLRSTSSSGPARFDYYDSEKKFKSIQPPKRSIPLHTCFNINKKSDTKHKYAIALYLINDSFSVIADSQEEQERWLNLMLEYQSEYLLEGEDQKPHYEFIWQGIVKHKTPQSCPGIHGPYRLCLSEKSVCMVKVTEYKPSFDFMLSSIRRCGHSDNFFFMEVGRSAVTGPGELWMQVEETAIAQSMHDKVLSEMTSKQSDFRGRSNTSGSTISRRSTIHGDEAPFIRKRATSESHHSQGSPRRLRGHPPQRPQSTVVYQRTLEPVPPVNLSASPASAFDASFFVEGRVRSDSMGSRSSRTSRHSDFAENYQNIEPSPVTDHSFIVRSDSIGSRSSRTSRHSDFAENYQNIEPSPVTDHSFIGSRSKTPETPVSITEEEVLDRENSDYLPMTPGQRSMTPSPTRFQGQMERSTPSSDYLPMTPTRRSGTPSPTRFIDRPGSSEPQDVSQSEGYMDMKPGSVVSSPASNSGGYIDMLPGQRTPTDPGPGYMVMDSGGWSRITAPIPIRSSKEVGYMDMGPSSQPLPTVKEGGSGEAYLPMSPAGQSPMSSEGLKPAKVFSYLSDDSMSGEFPKRAYSVGSRPTPKPTHRPHHVETLRRQPLDSSKSSSAPHLIAQKPRSPAIDPYNQNYMDMSSNASSLNQSLQSDTDSFMEMDFYRPRTASDSYGCRPRSSSFGKQVYQGHRPRSSSYGQASKLSKLVTAGRVDSFESVRKPSMEYITRKRSQESLSKYSCSSSESLKKFSDDMQKKASVSSDYMDMGAASPTIHGIGSPKADQMGYVDMTLGSSLPKQQQQQQQRGISPSSSSHSLGSSPASGLGHHEKSHEPTKVVHPSGKISQKQSFVPPVHTPQHAAQHAEQQLKVTTNRLKQADRKSPASSGKESEDESYVPFQPGAVSDKEAKQFTGSHDFIHKSHPSVKIQHGYSRSYDSAVKQVESSKKSRGSKSKREEKSKTLPKTEKVDKHDKDSKMKKEKAKPGVHVDKSSTSPPQKSTLQEKVTHGHSPTIDRKIDFIPESDLFSNARFTQLASSPDQNTSRTSVKKGDDSGYMEYLPGFEGDLGPIMSADKHSSVTTSPSINKHGMSNPQTYKQNKQSDSSSGRSEIPQSSVVKTVSDSDYVLSDPVSNVETVAKMNPSSLSDNSAKMLPGFEGDLGPIMSADKHSSVTTSPSINKHGMSNPQTNKHNKQSDSLSGRTDIPQSSVVKTVSDSDYVLSDPVSNVETVAKMNPSSSSDNSAKMLPDSSSYMDFDPVTSSGDKSSDQIRAPAPVKSFFLPSSTSDSDIDSERSGVTEAQSGAPGSSSSECKGDQGCCGSRASYTSNVGVSNIEQTKQTDTSVVVTAAGEATGVDISSDTQAVIGQNNKQAGNMKGNTGSGRTSKSGIRVDEVKAKFVVMTKQEQDVLDEGYIELDFSPGPEREPKKHHRSGSSTSSTSITSDKGSVKGVEVGGVENIPTPSPIVSYISEEGDSLRRPEVPISYICDHSDCDLAPKGHVMEPGSPSKQNGSKGCVDMGSSINKAPVVVNTGEAGQSSDVFVNSPVQPLNLSQVNQVFGTQLSRQSSMPLGPSYSPRTCEDIQSIRSRKASGPATLSGGSRKPSGSGSIGKQLEPLPAGQELQKQVSMPCMTIPMGTDKIPTYRVSEMGQRHSYTDLSQYEEMAPVNSLDNRNNGRSNSQQQLTDVSQENKLNYADLDLTGSSENVDEKPLPRVNYATINFEKTESLKNANSKEEVKFSI